MQAAMADVKKAQEGIDKANQSAKDLLKMEALRYKIDNTEAGSHVRIHHTPHTAPALTGVSILSVRTGAR